MRDLGRKLGTHQLSVRAFTLKDKKSMFRASEPDQHIVELSAHVVGRAHVVLRTWVFQADQEKAARAQYDQLVDMLK